MGKDQAPLQEHLWQIPEAQLVPDPPQYYKTHDIDGKLEMVEACPGTLTILSLADATPKTLVS